MSTAHSPIAKSAEKRLLKHAAAAEKIYLYAIIASGQDRLLELPEIIDQWFKAFFNLFLKYQQIFRLTGFSRELVYCQRTSSNYGNY